MVDVANGPGQLQHGEALQGPSPIPNAPAMQIAQKSSHAANGYRVVSPQGQPPEPHYNSQGVLVHPDAANLSPEILQWQPLQRQPPTAGPPSTSIPAQQQPQHGPYRFRVCAGCAVLLSPLRYKTTLCPDCIQRSQANRKFAIAPHGSQPGTTTDKQHASQSKVDLPPRPPPPPLKPIAQQRQIIPAKRPPPPNVRICASESCHAIVSSSSGTRCANCVWKDWKSRMERHKNKPLKRVKFADDVARSETDTSRSTPTEPPPTPTPLDSTLPDASMDVDAPVVASGDASGSVVDVNASPNGSVSEPPTAMEGMEATSTSRSDNTVSEPGSSQSSSRQGSHDSLDVVLENAPSSDLAGWDSPLTDLSDPDDTVSLDGDDFAEALTAKENAEIDAAVKATPAMSAAYEWEPNATFALGRKCARSGCQQRLCDSYRWRCCPRCRDMCRQYQRRKQGVRSTYQAKDYVSLEKATVPDGVQAVLGARVCPIGYCGHIIPAITEYQWKICHRCRVRTRKRTRMRLGKPADRPSKEVILVPRDPDPAGRTRCDNYDCGCFVEGAGSTECRQCIARKHKLREGEEPNKYSNSVIGPPRAPKLKIKIPGRNSSKSPDEQPVGKIKIKIPGRRPSEDVSQAAAVKVLTAQSTASRTETPYPTYQSLDRLLRSFSERLRNYVAVHAHYHSVKASSEPGAANGQKAMFAFDGEFSVVARDLDVFARRKEVGLGMEKINCELERVSGNTVVVLRDSMHTAVMHGGLMARYWCSYHDPLSDRRMKGELELVVVPDRSHRRFPGQRTVIRVRLID